MTGDEYRVKAAELQTRTINETNERLRKEFENLALQYLRLADQAERNAKTDVVYEVIPTREIVSQQEEPLARTNDNEKG